MFEIGKRGPVAATYICHAITGSRRGRKRGERSETKKQHEKTFVSVKLKLASLSVRLPSPILK